LVGRTLLGRSPSIVLPNPPLLAYWDPHVGWGSPLAVACLVVGLRLQRAATVLPWRRLLLAGWLLNLAWLCSLALVDGLLRGWISVLLNPNEYLHDLPRIKDPAAFVSTFTDFIALGPGVDASQAWTTHVAGHPPLATLIFWLLAEVGLGGGFWAGALCILASSATSLALPVALRELGAGPAARRSVPFVALSPGAVWMAVSADGMFAGVAVSGLALACIGAVRGKLLAGLAGGLLLGAAVFLSYGLVLLGIPILVAAWLTLRRRGWPAVGPWLLAAAGAAAVAVIHLAFGFTWLTGLEQLRIRYYQGIASQRPFSYFLYANFAAWLISCSPFLAIGIFRSLRVLTRRAAGSDRPERVVIATLALSGVLAALLADLSALSKAETERIWLTFGVLASSALALLKGHAAAWTLAGCAGTALLVNHLFRTGW
jgi:methylthioxylose transferase